MVGTITKEQIIESIREGAIVSDPATILGHMCVLIIALSEDIYKGKDEQAFANAMDGCEIATECVEMWIRTFANHDMNEILDQMSKMEGESDVSKLIDHVAGIKLLARRGRTILDAKKKPN